MKWPKSLTSPNAGGDAGADSCLVDRAADQRVATLRWYAAALNSRRSSAIARVESLEKDLVDAKAESADAKSSMLEAASKVRECAMESEANAAARRLLERDLSTTKADLAKARKLNVEGQMNRSSLRIELAEAKASVDAMASAMAQNAGPERYARRAQGEGIARQASRDDVIAELAAVHVRDGRLGYENGETPFTQFILDARQPGYEPEARDEDLVFKRRTQHRSAAGW